MIKKFTYICLVLLFTSPLANAVVCTKAIEDQITSSPMDDKSRFNMLKGFGCDPKLIEDLKAKIDAADVADMEREKKRNAAIKAADIAEKEAKQEKDQQRLNAQIEEDNARIEAFNQAMANKCGEYPLELKIGMSEKLLRMGCTGGVTLVGEDQSKRIYRTADALVTTAKGRVIRWIER